MSRRYERMNVGISTALLVIVVGVFFLVNELGMFPHGFRFSFWSVVFLAVGVGQMLSASRPHDRIWGVGLVLVGGIIQTNAMGITHIGFWNLWPVFIIVAGLSLLWHAVAGEPVGWIYHLRASSDATRSDAASSDAPSPDAPRDSDVPDPGLLNMNFVFSGTDRQIFDKHFKGGKISVVFGGFKLDLTRAGIEGDRAVLDLSAVFGGGELRVPETWRVVLEVRSGIFGVCEDKTRYFQPDPSAPAKTLIVRGSSVFGGIVIKN